MGLKTHIPQPTPPSLVHEDQSTLLVRIKPNAPWGRCVVRRDEVDGRGGGGSAAAVMRKMASWVEMKSSYGSGGDGGGVAWWWQPVRGGDREARGGVCEGGSNRSEDGEHYWSWRIKSNAKVFRLATASVAEVGGWPAMGREIREEMVYVCVYIRWKENDI
ncbi:hypothetical protein Tco_1367747 [Tanacetum coccineum]